MNKTIGTVLIIIGVLLCIGIFYLISGYNERRRIFSTNTLLYSSWEVYKQRFILPEGRVIDFNDLQRTTSEGQSYALLRAVIIDDKATFDRVLDFTINNLQREDKLFGWRWGEREDGSYGFLTDGGENSASDADSDIALALILAHRRWRQDNYLTLVNEILPALWNTQTTVIQNKRYLIAGQWANYPDYVIINPSYFAPYAWEEFAEIDTERDWRSLIQPSYELLQEVGFIEIENTKGIGLPPDWIALTRDGRLQKPPDSFSTNYSFDAMRVPFRIALHARWHNSEQARNYLHQSFTFLRGEWDRKKLLHGTYSFTGDPVIQEEHPIMYSTILPYFVEIHPDIAENLYLQKIIQLYSNDTNSFKETIGYYEQNWLWFAVAYMNNSFLPFK